MSAARNSSYRLQGLVTLLYRYRASSTTWAYRSYNRDFRSSNVGCGSYMNNHGLRFISGSTREADRKSDFNIGVKDDEEKVQPLAGPPLSKAWIFYMGKVAPGLYVGNIVTFLEAKMGELARTKRGGEKVVEEVEGVADVVEKVATVTEKLSAEVADKLPDSTVMKETALAVEHISSVTAADAHLTKDFIHKVEDVQQDLKDLETIVEPVIDKIIEVESAKK